MALITCPECGKKISDQAATCPNCGYPAAEERRQIQRLVSMLNFAARKKEAEAICINNRNNENNYAAGSRENTNKKPGFKSIKTVAITILSVILCVAVVAFIISNSSYYQARSGAKKLLHSAGYSDVSVGDITIRSKENHFIRVGITVSVSDQSKAQDVYDVLFTTSAFSHGNYIDFSYITVKNAQGKTLLDKNSEAKTVIYSPSPAISTPKSDSYSIENKSIAQLYAESYVKNELKAPSTAKFPSYDEYTYDLDGDNWTVSGYVDSQNSFGAMIRSDWTVTFSVSGKDYEKSELVSIDFQ